MTISLDYVFQLLEAEVLWGKEKLCQQIGRVYAGDMMSDVLLRTEPGDLLLTNLMGPQVMRTANMTDLQGVIVICQQEPPRTMIRLAREFDIPLGMTTIPLFYCCAVLHTQGVQGRGG